MLYEIRMDYDEACWIVNYFKRTMASTVAGLPTEISSDDVDRMQSFISRVRSKTRK